MKSLLLTFSLFIVGFLMQSQVFAFRVFPTTAQNELMFDKSNFPFIAENADGINLQHDSFGPFSESQVQTIFNQFKNKNFINHGVFKEDVQITRMSTMTKKPDNANVTAFMLYNEAPAMNAAEWESALSQNAPWPLITHCRAYSESANFNEIRRQIQITSGIMMEFQVTRADRFDDAAKLLKYCVDNDRMVVFLTTFQRSPDIFISAYKEFYYYLKENLAPQYLQSDNVIFVPNTYDDSQVFPETMGYGSTFGVAHWLIDQKSKVDDGYIQPKISFSSINDQDFFPNHSDITVDINVSGSDDVSNVRLFINDEFVGEDTEAPYSWNGGVLSDLTTGYKELKAVLTDASGVETSKTIQIRILDDPIGIPGFFNASEISNYDLRNEPDTAGFIRHVYGNEWIDYKMDVKHAGLYDVKVDIKVQRSKQYGGTIILKSGNRELGRFTTVLNDPDKDPLTGFTENPEVIIRNVQLSEGVQTIRAAFSHPHRIVKPQFYLYSFKFVKQGAPDISFTNPVKNDAGEYGSYDAPANIEIAAEVVSPRTEGKVEAVSLYINNNLVKTLNNAPFDWNDSGTYDIMNNLPAGDYMCRVEATDELGYTSFEEISLTVIARNPFNTNLTIPGTIKAWQFDMGGEGIGYHDFNEGLERGLSGARNPRYAKAGNEDAEIEMASGDYCVSAIRNEEWLSYTFSDVSRGVYDLIITTSANAGKSANVKVWMNNELLTTVPIKETGSNFLTFKGFKVSNVQITDDFKDANIRLEFSNPEIRNYLCFFRKFEFKRTGDVSSSSIKNEGELVSVYPNPVYSHFTVLLKHDHPADIVLYNMAGGQVLKLNKIRDKVLINRDRDIKPGIYFLHVFTEEYGVVIRKILVL